MPRAVSPWTWRRMLRDHGPVAPSFRLAMLTLGTYMNRDGYAFPSQPTWAKAACMSIRTIQRHMVTAQELGWLAVEFAGRGGQGWRHHAYRAAVPDQLRLDDLDESLTDFVEAQEGEIRCERGDTIVSSPLAERGDSIVSSASERGDNGGADVATTEAEGGDKRHETWRHNSVVLTPALRTPALRTLAKREAHASVRTLERVSPEAEPEETDPERHRKICDLLGKGYPVGDVAKFLRSSGVTLEEVQRVGQRLNLRHRRAVA